MRWHPLPYLALAAAISAVGACQPRPAPESAPLANADLTENVRRLGSILDYIAADYGGCVEDGRVVNDLEYAEQKSFLDTARELAKDLPRPSKPLALADELAALDRQVASLAPADEVAAAAHSLSQKLRAAYGVVIAPAAAPSRERGEALFAANCTECHGRQGAGDGPRVPELQAKYKVTPRSFQDAAVMTDMTAIRVFNALTDGVPDAGMPEWTTLTPAERWDLAFVVLGLRHRDDAAGRGEAAGRELARSPAQLAGVSDRELDAELARTGVKDAARRKDAVAYMRLNAPFEAGGAPLELARKHLSAALALARAGDRTGASREATAAYLDGFEPHEAVLRRHDEGLMLRIEAEMSALRDAIERTDDATELEQRVLRLSALTETADDILTRRGGGKVAYVTALVIVIREGMEAALLVLLILSLARGAGVTRRDARGVHMGWIAALVAGIVTWFAAGSLIGRISGASRELFEGLVAIAAALVLLTVSHFVLARIDAKRRVAALKQRLALAVSAPRRQLVLISLGFVAVYREAFETVLFLRALMLDAGVTVGAVAAGAATGAVGVIGVVFAMARLGKKLKPAPLLSALGTLLCLVSVVLVGKGMRSLQEAGTIGISPLGELRIDWLGVYPTTQTVLAQLAIALAFAGVALWALLRAQKTS